MDGLLTVLGLGVLGAVLAVLMKQHKPEYALAVSLLTGVAILVAATELLSPLMDELNALMDATSIPREFIGVLVKSLGVCFLTQVACDTCRDAGQSAIAVKLEMAGKLTVLALSLPLFGQLLDVVRQLLAA